MSDTTPTPAETAERDKQFRRQLEAEAEHMTHRAEQNFPYDADDFESAAAIANGFKECYLASIGELLDATGLSITSQDAIHAIREGFRLSLATIPSIFAPEAK